MSPTKGTSVVTADGQDVGQVIDIKLMTIKIRAPQQKDYWLDTACIQESNDDEVRLNLTKEELIQVKREASQGSFD